MPQGTGISIATFGQQSWYQGVFGALILIVILAMVLERALAQVFEWGAWDVWLVKMRLRAPIALFVSYLICAAMKFDILLVLGNKPQSDFALAGVGVFLTASTIAGGSKGAIALFQGVLQFAKGGNTEAVAEVIAQRDAKAVKAAKTPPAHAIKHGTHSAHA